MDGRRTQRGAQARGILRSTITASWYAVGFAGAFILAASGTPARAQTNSPLLEPLLSQAGVGDYRALEIAIDRLTDPADAAVARAWVAASRLDLPAVRRAARDYQASGDTNRRRAERLWSAVTGAAFADGNYALAAEAGLKWRQSANDAGERADADNLLTLASSLSQAPRQSIARYAPEPWITHYDQVGLLRAGMEINGHEAEAVLDTGANLSTVSASRATALGLHFLDGVAEVGSSTRSAVPVRLALARRLELAGITLNNVVFLVLPDEHMALPVQDYRLDLIVGLPVFRAMERVTFARDGSLSASRSTGNRRLTNLRYRGSTLFVAAKFEGRSMWLHLDTGAPATSLGSRFAKENADAMSHLERRTIRVAGAGGVVNQQTAIWPDATIEIDSAPAVLAAVPISMTPSSDTAASSYAGQIGLDVLRQYENYTIDFLARRVHISPARRQ